MKTCFQFVLVLLSSVMSQIALGQMDRPGPYTVESLNEMTLLGLKPVGDPKPLDELDAFEKIFNFKELKPESELIVSPFSCSACGCENETDKPKITPSLPSLGLPSLSNLDIPHELLDADLRSAIVIESAEEETLPDPTPVSVRDIWRSLCGIAGSIGTCISTIVVWGFDHPVWFVTLTVAGFIFHKFMSC